MLIGAIDYYFRTSFIACSKCILPLSFDGAAVLTLDGVGEWTTTSLAVGKGNDLNVVKEIRFPHSLGCFTLHSLITQDLK